jgi:CRISPR-associated protein Cmr5
MSTRQSTELKRARQAVEWVSKLKKIGGNAAKEYSSLARSAPADIQSNGLGQTLAFWRSKGWEKGKPKNNGHTLLYQHLSQWVCGRMGWDGKAKDHGLLSWLVEKDTSDYRRATVEAQAFLVWLKRFAEAELGEEGG